MDSIAMWGVKRGFKAEASRREYLKPCDLPKNVYPDTQGPGKIALWLMNTWALA